MRRRVSRGSRLFPLELPRRVSHSFAVFNAFTPSSFRNVLDARYAIRESRRYMRDSVSVVLEKKLKRTRNSSNASRMSVTGAAVRRPRRIEWNYSRGHQRLVDNLEIRLAEDTEFRRYGEIRGSEEDSEFRLANLPTLSGGPETTQKFRSSHNPRISFPLFDERGQEGRWDGIASHLHLHRNYHLLPGSAPMPLRRRRRRLSGSSRENSKIGAAQERRRKFISYYRKACVCMGACARAQGDR